MNTPNHIQVTTGKGERTLYNRIREQNEHGGYTHRNEPNGRETYTWRAEIDMTGLEHMAAQAARNKSGKSVDGPLKITITHRGAIIG